MEFNTSKLTQKSLDLAQKASHEVWEKYDDTYGYRSEKQKANSEVSTSNRENIWFFLNQFDPNNQQEFLIKIVLSEPDSEDKLELVKFVTKYLTYQADEMRKVREEFLKKKN